jgi:hypothetical protein
MFHMTHGKSHYNGSILKAEFIAVLTSSLLLNDPTRFIQLPSSVRIHFIFNFNRQSNVCPSVHQFQPPSMCIGHI